MPLLAKLWPQAQTDDKLKSLSITAICDDSRQVKTGAAFFARANTDTENQRYITAAISQGARIVFQEGESDHIEWQQQVLVITVTDCRQLLGEMASRFYGEPSKQLKIIGVTGTNGKTSVCHLAAQAFSYLGYKAAVLGTAGNGIWPQLKASLLTTLGVIELHQTLAGYLEQQVDVVFMEVSSHGLDQKRVAGVEFEIGSFTNLSRDHLDYHKTMAAYAKAKRSLFDLPMRQAVINADDMYGQQWLAEWPELLPVWSYGEQGRDFQLQSATLLKSAQTELQIKTASGMLMITTSLLGAFNFSNLTLIAAWLYYFKEPLEKIGAALSQVKSVSGRMQQFYQQNKPRVVVDYSHTPDALKQALKALRPYCQQQLICVFGCGGDRDQGKRPLMAEIAQKYADKCVITDDNPRFEDPEKIVADILTGFTDTANITITHDRKDAINTVINNANTEDVILIAGKGHEDYQIIKDQRLALSDLDIVAKAMEK